MKIDVLRKVYMIPFAAMATALEKQIAAQKRNKTGLFARR